MAKIYTLSWVPGAGVASQTVKYRIKNATTWLSSPGITAANPQTDSATSATIADLTDNTIYQFKVVSNCCPGTEASTDIIEGIIFAEVALDTSVLAGVISVDQAVMADVEDIEYVLYNGLNPIETVTATGTAPAADFASVAAGTYTVKYKYSTTINGGTVNSTDANQENGYYVTDSIVVS